MTEEELFIAALDLNDPVARAAYLDAACVEQPELRGQVEALLRAHEGTDRLLDGGLAQSEVGQTTQTAGPSATGSRQAFDADLAMLGPARQPQSLGSLDHYDVLEVAGRGGMGVVFKAWDIKLRRVVAIKVLATHLAADGTSRHRFVREAQAAAAIRDPHVVSIYAVHDEGAEPYLVMEFIGGWTLDARVKAEGPPVVREILRIALQAAQGLAAAHKQGLIHRDVKPANILLENGVQRVKLVDFGLARTVDGMLTQQGKLAGTPAYMSPEQTRGETLDERSDLFSLGSVLYFLCTGRHAFTSSTSLGTLKRVSDDTPVPIRSLNPDIPEWLAEIVNKLLMKSPIDRIQTATEVADILESHLARVQYAGPSSGQPAMLTRSWKLSRYAYAFGIVGFLVLGSLTLAGMLGWFNKKEQQLVGIVDQNSRVLTVSKNAEDGGEFRTINAALEKVTDDRKIIRVLDNERYEEQIRIDRTGQFRGLVLEGAPGKRPTLSLPKGIEWRPPHAYCVGIKDVPNVTIQGFRIFSRDVFTQVFLAGVSPGCILSDLDLSGDHPFECICLELWNLPLESKQLPVVIQKCRFDNKAANGIVVSARVVAAPFNKPLPCRNIVIRDNDFINVRWAVGLYGAPERAMVVGNRFVGCPSGIDLREFLNGTNNIYVANNTTRDCGESLRIWDQDNEGLNVSSQIHFCNNLILSPPPNGDLYFFNHLRGDWHSPVTPGNRIALFQRWSFSHNWRELTQPAPMLPTVEFWIPGPNDVFQKEIPVLSRIQGNPNHLRPAKDSKLATSGVGAIGNAIPLPSYVGAVAPEGVEPWDWGRTWDALANTK